MICNQPRTAAPWFQSHTVKSCSSLQPPDSVFFVVVVLNHSQNLSKFRDQSASFSRTKKRKVRQEREAALEEKKKTRKKTGMKKLLRVVASAD